jgi:hypothetical protein
MRVEFPRARILDPTYPVIRPITSPAAGQCLILVAGEGDRQAQRARFTSLEPYLAETMKGHAEAPFNEGVVVAPMLSPAKGELRLAYRLYDGPNGDCR